VLSATEALLKTRKYYVARDGTDSTGITVIDSTSNFVFPLVAKLDSL